MLRRTALRLAVANAGSNKPAMTAIIAMTTMSSINVNALSVDVVLVVSME
jgi:hypothetical protein